MDSDWISMGSYRFLLISTDFYEIPAVPMDFYECPLRFYGFL